MGRCSRTLTMYIFLSYAICIAAEEITTEPQIILDYTSNGTFHGRILFERMMTKENSTSTFPLNLTDKYEAKWHIKGGGYHLKKTIEFTGTEGALNLDLINHPTNIEQIHTVKGQLSMRDGHYITDRYVYYNIQGFYFPIQGALYLLGNPFSGNIISNFSLELSPKKEKSGIAEAFWTAETTAVQTIAKGNNVTQGQPIIPLRHHVFKDRDSNCFVVLVATLGEKDRGFNHRWNYIYDVIAHKKYLRDKRLAGDDSPEERPKVDMEGYIYSPNCLYESTVTLHSLSSVDIAEKAGRYTLVMSLVTVGEILFMIAQIKHTNTQSMITKVSLLSMAMTTMMDCYIGILHISTALLWDNMFNPFALVAFLKVSLFGVFEVPYFMHIWRTRRPNHADPRQDLGYFYLRLYALLLIIPTVVLWFVKILFPVVIFVGFSFYLPQIYCNVLLGSCRALHIKYIIGMALARSVLPAYLLACPYNFVKVENQPMLVLMGVSWLFFQVVILILQDHLGPRFFVPSQLIPVKYNYFRPVTRDHTESVECVICMNSVELPGGTYMVTPCEHIFHDECLQRWLEQKLECPTCRRTLPLP